MKKFLCILFSIALLCGCEIRLDLPGKTEGPPQETTIRTAEPDKKLDTVTVAMANSEFQPHSVASEHARYCLGFIYEPLFERRADQTAAPKLANSLEADGTNILIYIKKGVKFHDGSDFTADDAAFSINMVAGGYSVYKSDRISSARVVNTGCVAVTLREPVAAPELLFTFPIVKSNAPQTMSLPNGTGPFCYNAKSSFDTYLFKVFDRYHDKLPSFSNLRIINAPDEERVRRLFDAGETDMISIDSSELSSYTPRVNSQNSIYPTDSVIMLGFNCQSVNEHIRRAVYSALDTETMTKNLFPYTGEFSPIPIIPGSAFVTEDMYESEYSVEEAESRMQRGGFERTDGIYRENGAPITLDILVESADLIPLFDAVASSLGAFGITCKRIETDNAIPYLESGAFDVFICSRRVSVNMGDILGSGNIFRYENPQFIYISAIDVQSAVKIFKNDVPVIPVCFKTAASAAAQGVPYTLSPSFTSPFAGNGGFTN